MLLKETVMPKLFERTCINGLELANRFIRSATWEGLADEDGSASHKLTEMMVELAKGEVGLIISSYAFVSPEGQSSRWQLAVYGDRFLPGLRDMAQAVHAVGGKIALQLVHAGANSDQSLSGLDPVGPSSGKSEGKPTYRQAGIDDIAAFKSAFAQAAVRAKKAGFDAVQIHAAHGFLLSQFLSPVFNKRTDGYGGCLDSRARLLLEVAHSVRESVGPAYPVFVKLNSDDFMEGGMTSEEAIKVAAMLGNATVDAVELSGGTVASPEKLIPSRPGILKTPENEVYYRESAQAYKQNVSVPLMLVGGIRSYEVADNLVKSGSADYISLSRPLISEPALIRRWHEGDHRKARCISCNECFGPAVDGKGVYCVAFENREGITIAPPQL